MIISDRSITLAGEIFSICSAAKFSVLSEEQGKDWTVRCSHSIPQSEQEIHTLESKSSEELALLIKPAAGSRRIDLLGAKA